MGLLKPIVLDTNLVVSAFLKTEGPAFEALLVALEHFEVIASQQTFQELVEVLQRDKFDRYLPRPERAQRLQRYAEALRFCQVTLEVQQSPDPKDDKFLALAAQEKAALIVSGDKKDLLALRSFQGIAIVSLQAFLQDYARYA